MSVAFVTFGTPDFSMARAEHEQSIQRFGHRVFSYHIGSEPIQLARKKNAEIFRQPRGYGYWAWKPYIIEAAMDATEPGTLVFYTDIAVTLARSPEPLLDLLKDLDVATFRVGSGYLQREYTKRDAFVLMKADEPRYWDDEQSNGAFVAIRNNDAGLKFVRTWKKYLKDTRILTDKPNEMKFLNHPEFVDHRHDQSALSILATRDSIPLLRDPSQWGNDGTRSTPDFKPSSRFNHQNFGQIFFHHRRRNRDYSQRFA